MDANGDRADTGFILGAVAEITFKGLERQHATWRKSAGTNSMQSRIVLTNDARVIAKKDTPTACDSSKPVDP